MLDDRLGKQAAYVRHGAFLAVGKAAENLDVAVDKGGANARLRTALGPLPPTSAMACTRLEPIG